jgi:H+/gluconate symporter-like permease
MGQIIGLIVISIFLGWVSWKWLGSNDDKPEKSSPLPNSEENSVQEKPSPGSRIAISGAVALLCIPGAVLIGFLAVIIKGTGGEDWLVNLIEISYLVLSLLFIGYVFINPKRNISKNNKK